ncbi:hypothetical protein [Algibacter sp. 2305UL17-15]|uniref:hypothetical protein n=1 Tax=Algibacter sp. 2305UL17-15 TaxID=3231268 RepID=UPI003457DCA0
MNLKCPTIIPLDTAVLAESLFKPFIGKSMMIIIIIIGLTSSIREAISKANNSEADYKTINYFFVLPILGLLGDINLPFNLLGLPIT